MTDPIPDLNLNHPWLVAVWPGMGNVALTGGYYLMSKMHMFQAAEFRARDLFEIDHVQVHRGIVSAGPLPRSRFFVWRDPKGERDIIVFIGEAQPPVGKYSFCHRLLEFASRLHVERLFTFAAMATEMHPSDRSRVFGVATDQEGVEELKRLEVEVLDDGQIAGLNGILLAVGAERGLRGMGLLGEMPVFASQVLFPKASLSVLEAFATLANIDLDLTTLKSHAAAMEKRLVQLLEQMQQVMQQQESDVTEQTIDLGDMDEPEPEPEEKSDEPSLTEDQLEDIETLFARAKADRSRAYELKQELDRLGVFRRYEDRFLDLFKHQ